MLTRFMHFFSVHSNSIQSIGIILSLAFTAAFTSYQLRIGSNAQDQQEYGSLMQQQQDIFLSQIENSAVYTKSLQNPEELEPHELWVVAEIIYIRLEFLRRYQKAFDKGVVSDEEDLNEEYKNTVFYLGTPIGKIVWNLARGDYESDKKILEKIDAALKVKEPYPDDKLLEDLVRDHKMLKSNRAAISKVTKQEAGEIKSKAER
jgi:hypothetical protein